MKMEREDYLRLFSALSDAAVKISKKDKADILFNGTKVAKVGINKEEGWTYYIDKDGDIARVRKGSGNKGKKIRKKSPAEKNERKERDNISGSEMYEEVRKDKIKKQIKTIGDALENIDRTHDKKRYDRLKKKLSELKRRL
ncbi:MAG: hypothetical protein ACQEP1_04630 [Nanobdellota archaeon]